MKSSDRFDELHEAFHLAYRNWVYAQDALESEVGSRLRAHQQVTLSVLVKANGKPLPTEPSDPHFLKGKGAWAVALRHGFEVVKLEETKIIVRALVEPGADRPPVTYTLDRAWLFYSDRQMASLVRASVQASKAKARANDAWKRKREAREVAKLIAEKTKELAKLEAKHAQLTPSN